MSQPDTSQAPARDKRGAASFCVPRAALEALLRENATAYEICTYLIFAKFTDKTGCYSCASVTAVNTYTGANKTRNGPVAKAIERLKTIRVKVANSGRKNAADLDRGPILFDREMWIQTTGEIPPDGEELRAQVRYVLPDFSEPLADRVWFGGNLVTGVGEFTKPLKALKNAGDKAAQLLLTMYAANDMETWGGIPPTGPAPWRHYEPVAQDVLLPGLRVLRWKQASSVAVFRGDSERSWRALEALESNGLIYEAVLVLNRNGAPATFGGSGDTYNAVPGDAEPLYALDTRSDHGYQPVGEDGLSGLTAKTAGELGCSVALPGGRFDLTYAAIVPRGYPAMIAGIFRLRFRVSNPKNAGVRQTWARIHDNNREWLKFLQSVRGARGLEPVEAPLHEAPDPASL